MEVVQPIRDPALLRDIADYLNKKNERDYVLFATGIYTGLRISDMLMLQVRDVRGKTHIKMKEGKTGKRKTVKISNKLQAVFNNYISDKEDYEYLFRSRQGRNEPISRARAYEILKEAACYFKLPNIGCHSMRKTFGYMLYLQSKNNIVLVQELLNHSSPEVTLRYIGLSQEYQDNAIDDLELL